MARSPNRIDWLAFAAAASVSTGALAQSDPSSASFPPDPAQPAAPAPAPADAAPAPEPAPAPAEPTAAPAAYEPEYPPLESPPPPPPPERPPGEGFKMPPFSVRVDPFKWLLDGQLGFELEAGVLDFLSIEVVPMFVVNKQPPTFNYFVGRDEPITRESDGLGPLAGASISAGFWLEGKPLRGYVLRVILTNFAYQYRATDEDGEFDNVSHVERQLFGYFGSHARWGAFTLAGGIGLGVELNSEERCIENDPPNYPATRSGCDGELDIKATRGSATQPPALVDLSGGLGGVQLLGRFSLGVAID